MIYKYGNFEAPLDPLDIDAAEKMQNLISALDDMQDVDTSEMTIREAGEKLCAEIDSLLIILFGEECIPAMFGEFKNIRQRFEALAAVIDVWRANMDDADTLLKAFA